MSNNPFEVGTLNHEMYSMTEGEAFTWSRRVRQWEPVAKITDTKLALKRFVQGRLNIFNRNNDGVPQTFKMEQGIMQTRNGDILVIVAVTKK